MPTIPIPLTQGKSALIDEADYELVRPMTLLIYGLWCPLSGEIRYVGKTDDLRRRMQQHLRDGADTHKGRWVRSLVQRGLEPAPIVLESVTSATWREAEQWWIAKLRGEGHHLTNSTRGGYGPGMFLPHIRAKMSASRKAWWSSLSEDERAAYRAAAATRARQRLKGRPLSPDHIEKMRQSQTGKTATDQARERQSHARREWWAGLTPDERATFIAMRAERMVGHETRPETAERIRQALRGRQASDEHRHKLSAAHKARWAAASDEERREMTRGLSHGWSDESRQRLALAHRGRKNQHATSPYRGVSWFKRDACWRSWIRHGGKQRHLGYYATQEEAARAYDEAARVLFGPLARCNFSSE